MTESSGDAARDRMQPPAFWHDLGAEFQGLPDSVWANRDALARLQMSDGKVCGGDASLRSRFKDIAGRGGMALCAERGLSADLLDALWVWEDAVMAYLKEEKNPWYREVRSTRWKPGPAKKQELALSAIRPRHDEPHYTLDEALRFNAWVERIQREGMNELLVVTADDQRYVVIDDEHEDLKYWACARAGVTSLTCDVRSASNPGAREDVLVDTIDCISVASADLCGRLETEAFGRQLTPPVEQRVTPPDRSATSAPMTTPRTRRDRVDDFLARCNHEYQGPDKLTRKDIWAAAYHATARQFERWQKNDKHATKTDHKNFERILGMAPQEFIHVRAKKQRSS